MVHSFEGNTISNRDTVSQPATYRAQSQAVPQDMEENRPSTAPEPATAEDVGRVPTLEQDRAAEASS